MTATESLVWLRVKNFQLIHCSRQAKLEHYYDLHCL
jgi:hypothetical protein